jgi:YHS domain-containing protein
MHPVCGMPVDPETAEHHGNHADREYPFCGKGCADAFDAETARYATTRGRRLIEPRTKGPNGVAETRSPSSGGGPVLAVSS